MKQVSLGEYASFIRGLTFKPVDKVEVGSEQSVVCMRTKNVQAVLDEGDLIAVPSRLVKKSEKLLREGDILVSSANSWNLVGKCCWVPNLDYESTAGGFISVLRTVSKDLDARYLYRWFSSDVIQQTLRSFGNKTTNIANLDHRRSLNLQIPLPPLEEQRRIAGILDAADALRAKRRESLAQLDTFLQSTFIDLFGDPGQNTKQLPTISLGDIGKWRSGGTPPRQRADFFSGDIPWFSSGELEEMYVFNSEEKITDSAIRETSAKRVPAGSLMLGMYDTAALKAAFAGVDCSCNQAIAFSLLDEEICAPLYVYTAISIGKEYFRRLQRGVRQKNLNLGMIRSIRIPNPSLDLQNHFASIVESVEQQKAKQRAHLAELNNLFGALQQRAFCDAL